MVQRDQRGVEKLERDRRGNAAIPGGGKVQMVPNVDRRVELRDIMRVPNRRVEIQHGVELPTRLDPVVHILSRRFPQSPRITVHLAGAAEWSDGRAIYEKTGRMNPRDDLDEC